MNETKKYKIEFTREELLDLLLACLDQKTYYTEQGYKLEKKEERQATLEIAKDYNSLMKKINDFLDTIIKD